VRHFILFKSIDFRLLSNNHSICYIVIIYYL